MLSDAVQKFIVICFVAFVFVAASVYQARRASFDDWSLMSDGERQHRLFDAVSNCDSTYFRGYMRGCIYTDSLYRERLFNDYKYCK